MYLLSSKKLEILNKYLKKNLAKKFISVNKALFVFSILFVIKLNDQLRFCVNYRKFNAIIKRNKYSISLIEKILIKIINCKYIFKLDIIVIFNRLRIDSKSELFTIFIISLEIYKYYIFFFDLTKDLAS